MINSWAKKTKPRPTVVDLKDKLDEAFTSDLIELDGLKVLDEFIKKHGAKEANSTNNNNEQQATNINATSSDASGTAKMCSHFVGMEEVFNRIFFTSFLTLIVKCIFQ